jgi:hypothetical protein
MSTILDCYKLKFYKTNYKNSVSGIVSIDKICAAQDTSYYIIASFLNDYYRVQKVQNIVDMIDNVLNSSTLEGETGSESGIAVYIAIGVTKFVYFNSGTYLNPDLTIPTADFNAIVTEWKQFLTT